MKIKTKRRSAKEVLTLSKPAVKNPKKPNLFFRTLIRVLSSGEMMKTRFTYTTHGMEKVQEPCLVLMNHSGFIDLKIAYKILYPKPFGIVCTSDGFVGKEWLMRLIGCIPTNKFVTDISLLRNINYALKEKNMSVLMYPEASYSFDGTATPLPRRMGVLLKKLKVPVVTIITDGAFLRNPLYNNLQNRKVTVSAKVSCLFTKEEIAQKSVEELDAALDEVFGFDHFAAQKEKGIVVDEPFRADGLHRILYQCPHCLSEGKTVGEGTVLTCRHCGKQYEMDELGQMHALDGDTLFSHIPRWYAWQRQQVKEQLEQDIYRLETPVEIGVLADYKAIYMVGGGTLTHTKEGFRLISDDGTIDYTHSPLSSYGLYADYYWYQIADVICIGNGERLYYCFPKGDVPVAKARLATEELYKMMKRQRKKTTV